MCRTPHSPHTPLSPYTPYTPASPHTPMYLMSPSGAGVSYTFFGTVQNTMEVPEATVPAMDLESLQVGQ